MFRKLPGDEARNLVSITPDTAVVFRPAVVRTPVIITLVIWLYRLLAGSARLLWRHPVAVSVPLALGVIWTLYGHRPALAVVGVTLTAGTSWALLAPAPFARMVGWRLLAWWRLIWVYRRHWQPVMIVSGLGKHLRGRDYLPRLLRVTCDDSADRVTVRTEHLAHGFGAPSCHITVPRPERLTLTFPRRLPPTR